MLKEHVFQLHRRSQPLLQPGLVEEVAHLDARFGVLVGVEGSDAALSGAEGFTAQPGLLVGILKNVVGQQQLRPVSDHELGGGHSLGLHLLQLGGQLGDV